MDFKYETSSIGKSRVESKLTTHIDPQAQRERGARHQLAHAGSEYGGIEEVLRRGQVEDVNT